jgi:hypothetical protein
MRNQVARKALESPVIHCPYGIVAHILHDPCGLLTLPYKARLYRMTNRYALQDHSSPRSLRLFEAFLLS